MCFELESSLLCLGAFHLPRALADILSFTFFLIVGTSQPLDDGRQCGGPYAREAFGSPFVCPERAEPDENVSQPVWP